MGCKAADRTGTIRANDANNRCRGGYAFLLLLLLLKKQQQLDRASEPSSTQIPLREHAHTSTGSWESWSACVSPGERWGHHREILSDMQGSWFSKHFFFSQGGYAFRDRESHRKKNKNKKERARRNRRCNLKRRLLFLVLESGGLDDSCGITRVRLAASAKRRLNLFSAGRGTVLEREDLRNDDHRESPSSPHDGASFIDTAVEGNRRAPPPASATVHLQPPSRHQWRAHRHELRARLGKHRWHNGCL